MKSKEHLHLGHNNRGMGGPIKTVHDADKAVSNHLKQRGLILIVLVVLLLLLMVVSASIGIESIGFKETVLSFIDKITHGFSLNSGVDIVLFDLRLPRVLLAVSAGMGLALAGAAAQGVLMNPLVSPMILGISFGAAFGASLAIVLGVSLVGVGRYVIMTNAFLLAAVTMFITYGIARMKGASKETIILAGVAVGFIFSGLVSGMQYVAKESDLRELVFWMMGSLWNARLEVLLVILPVILLSFLVLMKMAWDLNSLSAGEEVAKSLGVSTARVRFIALSITALCTAAVVSFTGVIGFIGLMAPHMARILIGVDHRYLLPASALVGGMLLLAADTVARSIVFPVEIPVGIMTALMGGPFFIYLLWRRKGDWQV